VEASARKLLKLAPTEKKAIEEALKELHEGNEVIEEMQKHLRIQWKMVEVYKALLVGSDKKDKRWKAAEKMAEQDVLQERKRANAMAKPKIPISLSATSPQWSMPLAPSITPDSSQTHDWSLFPVWTDGPPEVPLPKAFRPTVSLIQSALCVIVCVCLLVIVRMQVYVEMLMLYVGSWRALLSLTKGDIVTANIGSIAQNSTRHRVVSLVGTGAQRAREVQAFNSWSYNKGVDESSHLNEKPRRGHRFAALGCL